MELRGEVGGIRVYDDFAHHPTRDRAPPSSGLRRKVGAQRILAVFEPRSNTMKLGTMKAQLPWALEDADLSFCLQGDYGWNAGDALAPMGAAGRGVHHGGCAGGARRAAAAARRPACCA
jgi:UDP-N-acetylmuramate: L-alanyl-gamma-D-glutamyl-meso-diaminopimelate ligase